MVKRQDFFAFADSGQGGGSDSGDFSDDSLLTGVSGVPASDPGGDVDGDGGQVSPASDAGDEAVPVEMPLGAGDMGEARAKGGRGGKRPTGNERFHITADRPIFTLSVAADLLGLHPRTLRIYEEKKLVVPSRTEGNRRRYSQRDIERFQFIRYLTSGGVNLEGVRIILDMADELRNLGGDPSAIIERNLVIGEGED